MLSNRIGVLAGLYLSLSLGLPGIIAADQPNLKWNREGEPYKAAKERAVEYVKNLKASEIEAGLSEKTFGQWVAELLGSDIQWGRNDCGEGGDREGPVPVCVSVERASSSLFLYIAIGNSDGTVDAHPQFFFGGMREGGRDYQFRKLSDVPKALDDVQRNAKFNQANPLRSLMLEEATVMQPFFCKLGQAALRSSPGRCIFYP